MLELYINEYRVDLDSELDIKMTYESNDMSNPQATKNNFSKTIKLKGTPNNNRIFKHCYNISSTFDLFNPNTRIPFSIVNNGNLYEEGYARLTEINTNGSEVEYSVSLFGVLGDWFYSLMYDENGKSLTLEDVFFGFCKNDGTQYLNLEEENSHILFNWDRNFINEGWTGLYLNEYSDMRPSRWIKAVPTYSGYYDDFDNNKFLVNYNSLTDEEKERFVIPENMRTYDGYILCTGQRDMDEWECLDLRSNYQRPAIKTSLLLEKICQMNEYTAGTHKYKINIDDNIKNNPYFSESWVMFDRLDFNSDTEKTGLKEFVPNHTIIENTGGIDNFTIKLNYLNSPIIDTSDMENPNIYLDYKVGFSCNNVSGDVVGTSGYAKKIYKDVGKDINSFYGGVLVYTEIYNNDELYRKITPTMFTTKYLSFLSSEEDYGKYIKSEITDHYKKQIMDVLLLDDLNIEYRDVILNTTSNLYEMTLGLKIEEELPVSENVRVQLKIRPFTMVGYSEYESGVPWLLPYMLLIDRDSIGNSIVNTKISDSGYFYDGKNNPVIQNVSITKKILFGSTKTPFDYLMSFSKMFGFKYFIDTYNSTINLMSRGDYYSLKKGSTQDNNIQITDIVDNSSVKIKTNLIPYISWSLNYDYKESYSSELFSKRYSSQYGSKIYKTESNFNNDTFNVLDNNIYSGVVPYTLNSIYFNYIENYPQVCLSPTYEYTVYDIYNNEETKKVNGYYAYNTIYKVYDNLPKLCCFDNDNKSIDLDQTIIFYDQFQPIPKTKLSDNTDEMLILNDKPCHTISNYKTKDKFIEVDMIPHFWNYLTSDNNIWENHYPAGRLQKNVIYSLEPDIIENINTEGELYLFPKLNYSYATTLSSYWKNYMGDIYGKNVRSITINLYNDKLYGFQRQLVSQQPQGFNSPHTALRYFYIYDGVIWSLNKIIDYNPNENKFNIELIRVEDKNNYTVK